MGRVGRVCDAWFVFFLFRTLLLSSFWTSRGHSVVPSPPRFLPSISIAHRVQHSHCSSISHRVLLTHALALSAIRVRDCQQVISCLPEFYIQGGCGKNAISSFRQRVKRANKSRYRLKRPITRYQRTPSFRYISYSILVSYVGYLAGVCCPRCASVWQSVQQHSRTGHQPGSIYTLALVRHSRERQQGRKLQQLRPCATSGTKTKQKKCVIEKLKPQDERAGARARDELCQSPSSLTAENARVGGVSRAFSTG